MQPPFRRYATPGSVTYEVLSSKGKCYYTVSLLAGVAIDCECRHIIDKKTGNMIHLKQRCKHMTLAEAEEVRLAAPPVSYVDAPRDERGTLNREPGFSLTR